MLAHEWLEGRGGSAAGFGHRAPSARCGGRCSRRWPSPDTRCPSGRASCPSPAGGAPAGSRSRSRSSGPFAAARGRGAELNGRALACAGIPDLGEAVVGVSLASRRRDTEAMLRLCRSLSGKVRKLRSFGATGYDLAQIAAGRLGGLAQKSVNLWDAAAGALIIEESGGVVEGRPTALGRWDLIAGASGIHPALSALAREAWSASA